MKHLTKIISFLALALLVSGCISGPKTPKEPTVDSNLPIVTSIKTISDMTSIGFEWTPIYDEGISGYYIYRKKQDENTNTLERIATIEDRYASHYVDAKLTPSTTYIYSMSTYLNNKQESRQSQNVVASTLKTIEPVPFVQAIMGLPNRIKIIWRPHPSQKVSSYIVERNDFSSTKWEYRKTINGRLNAEYIDSDLKSSKSYRYRVSVKTYDGLTSEPSQVVEAQTKQLPPIIKNLTISRDLPKKIVLSWEAVSLEDFVYYKVYRSPHPNLYYGYLAKTDKLKFEDLLNDNGLARYYYVTAVDKDGLESPRQAVPIMGTTLSIPAAPSISVARQDSTSVMLGWSDVSRRAIKYQVTKSWNGQSIAYTNILGNSFVDQDIVEGTQYKYTVIAIDEYGLSSKASKEAVVLISNK